MECAHCHRTLSGRRRLYCDARCKKRAWRRRRAGLREDVLPAGGRRGHVPLAGATRAQRDEVLAETLAVIRSAIADPTDAVRAAESALRRSGAPAAKRTLDEISDVRAELRAHLAD